MLQGLYAPYVSYPRFYQNQSTESRRTALLGREGVVFPSVSQAKLEESLPAAKNPYWNRFVTLGDVNTVACVGTSLYSFNNYGCNIGQLNLGNFNPSELVCCSGPSSFILARDLEGAVNCYQIGREGTISKVFENATNQGDVRVALATTQYALSTGSRLSLIECGSTDPIFWFPSSVGPVRFLPEDENILLHGGEKSVQMYDVREGGPVSDICVHPAAVSLTAYTKDLSYSMLAVNPKRSTEIVAFSQTHSVLQMFDSRINRSPVVEFQLPIKRAWRNLEYNSSGSRILISEPYSYYGFVVDVFGSEQVSCLRKMDLVEPRSAQIHKYNNSIENKRNYTTKFVSANTADAEVSVGACFVDSAVHSFTSKGRIFQCFPNAPGTNTLTNEIRERFSNPDIEAQGKIVGLEQIAHSLFLRSRTTKYERQKLRGKEQAWLLSFLGIAGQFVDDEDMATSKPGSFLWNRAADKDCSFRQIFPEKLPAAGIRRFSFFRIQMAFSETMGEYLSIKAIWDYCQYLSSQEPGWCRVWIESEQERGVVCVEIFERKARRPKKRKPIVIKKQQEEEPSVISQENSSSSSDDEDITKRVDLVKPMLVVKELFSSNPDDHRVITQKMIAQLRSAWGTTQLDTVSSPVVQMTAITDSEEEEIPEAVVGKSVQFFESKVVDEDDEFSSKRTASISSLPTPPPARIRRAGF
jgi:hypothetical protein